jgi:hypothetical protein
MLASKSQTGRRALAAATLATMAMPLAACAEDGYGQVSSAPPPPVYSDRVYYGAPQGDYRNPPPEPSAPAEYNGQNTPPPPPGYAPSSDAPSSAADQAYAAQAQRWATENCVKSKGDTASGALVGGILGAIVGSALGGRHDGGLGTVAGAAIGAMGGAAVAENSGGDTSPGCPPGYVVRRDAARYTYQPEGYYYAAPQWYRPWVFVGGAWAYRPYPYHDYYYRTYRAPRGDLRGPRGEFRGEHRR